MLWQADTTALWLRKPSSDANGHYVSLLVRSTAPPPPPPLRPTLTRRIEDAFKQAAADAMAHPFKAALLGVEMNSAAIDQLDCWISTPADGLLNRHPAVKDGIVIGGEVAGFIAGVAVVIACGSIAGVAATGVAAVFTLVAGTTCLCLLVADGVHFWYAVTGNDAARTRLDNNPWYRRTELIARVHLAGPAGSGPGAMRELGEAKTAFAGVGARRRRPLPRSRRHSTAA